MLEVLGVLDVATLSFCLREYSNVMLMLLQVRCCLNSLKYY